MKKYKINLYYSEGFYTKNSIYLEGVWQRRGSPLEELEHKFIRFVRSYFIARELSNAKVILKINGKEVETRTDDNGYFYFSQKDVDLSGDHFLIKVITNSGIEKTIPIELENLSDYSEKKNIIITDIDDTILETNTTSWFKKLLNTLSPARKRKPVEQTRELINILTEKADASVYLSNSEQNLRPLLTSFLEINNFSPGLLILQRRRSWKDLLGIKSDDIQNFKLDRATRVIELLQNANFYLIGDNTQRDPNVYNQLFEHFPDRIDKIFIHCASDKKVDSTAHYLKENKVPHMLFDDQSVFKRDAVFQ